MTTQEVPQTGPCFEAMMVEIDEKLSAGGNAIPGRPFLAVREVSLRYEIAIPLGGAADRFPPDLQKYAPLSDAINDWYSETYGDRLKEDPCPGRTALVVDGDMYVLRIPRIFGGEPRWVISRTFLDSPRFSRSRQDCNLLQLLEGMTAVKAARLSDRALKEVADAFGRALPASYILENTQHALMYHARGDVATAIDKLMDRGDRFGESKWASLQASEKAIKAAIDLRGGSFKHTHNLSELYAQLVQLEVNIRQTRILNSIQCNPKIRYGAENCTREQALKAHQASLDLVNLLDGAGAFRTVEAAKSRS